ncbi:Sulfite exporter TauE/SafE [Delftia tsuruhatensis]|uniref:sulfite exporter TauE/SafE family protein n=1 Tax=Delftia tsuruhatensis TaxID=180282 RepID=UPI001E7CF4D2|nr:sulfite exporter TauE/SafE family protein [Delftia tsuruhatensis]CAB5722030.1 Sulfite exporter TauE/SafE [Delftia tsuruhatensis]CAC9688517.1 Sulfite exporter TauE/SafE [Delftia tsuruhatensis]
MWDGGWMLGAAVAVFALAGVVKGVVGLGLPTLSMALLALFMPAGQAAAWLLLPSLVTNVVQMRPLPALWPLLRRLGWMQLGIVIGTVGGMLWWGPVGEAAMARTALGVALVLYALWGLWGPSLQLPERHQGWLGLACGLLTGAITALTGVFVVPAVAFLQSLALSRQALMQAMGLCFTVSTLALGAGMALARGAEHGALAWGSTALVSALMLLPALAGMAWGERLRQSLSPQVFKRVLMLSLLALGIYMCARG